MMWLFHWREKLNKTGSFMVTATTGYTPTPIVLSVGGVGNGLTPCQTIQPRKELIVRTSSKLSWLFRSHMAIQPANSPELGQDSRRRRGRQICQIRKKGGFMTGNHSSCARRRDLSNCCVETQQEQGEGKVAASAAHVEGWKQGRTRKGNKSITACEEKRNGCSLQVLEEEHEGKRWKWWLPMQEEKADCGRVNGSWLQPRGRTEG